MKIMHFITPFDLACGLAEDNDYDHRDIAELIKALDAKMQDYEFTFELAKHFVEVLASEDEKGGEVFDINSLLPPKGE